MIDEQLSSGVLPAPTVPGRLHVLLGEPRQDPEGGGGARRLDIARKLLASGFSLTVSGSALSEAGASALSVGATTLALADQQDERVGREVVPGGAPDGAVAAARDELGGDHRPAGASGARVRWISGLDADGVVEVAKEALREASARHVGGWKPWFPVIDYKRCTNCMQCLSFCLFDVYGVDGEGKIQVQNPDKCKTNCPACSRVCPDVAILFPKYGAGPINGAEVAEADLDREKMKTDISALLGGDIYTLLRERHRKADSRFSKERDAEKALKERLRCLKELEGLLAEVPPEVLMALPSPDEIRKRAAQAARKADGIRAARGDAGDGAPPKGGAREAGQGGSS